MPTLNMQGSQVSYSDQDILNFPEGLLGLPHLRRMLLVKQREIEPFMWLAPVDAADIGFVVVEARTLFPDYSPALPPESNQANLCEPGEAPVVLAIVLVARHWPQTTANLRAPIFVSPRSMRAAQVVLSDSQYAIAAPLPIG